MGDVDLAAGGLRSTRVRNRSRSPVTHSASTIPPNKRRTPSMRYLGAVLGPVGFHHAGLRLVDRETEAALGPERPQLRPQLLRRQQA